MKKAFIATIIIFCSNLTHAKENTGNSFRTDFGVELKPSSLAQESLKEDQVSADFYYDQKSSSVFMVGRHYLWKWNLVSGEVGRVLLPENIDHPFQVLGVRGSNLWAAEAGRLWKLTRDKNHWHPLSASFCQKSSLLPFLPNYSKDQNFLGVSPCGVLQLDSSGENLSPLSSVNFKVQENHFLMTRHHLVRLDGKTIHRTRLDTPKSDELVYTANSKILGISAAGDLMIAWTLRSIIFFESSFRKIKVVPTEGGRRIKSVGGSSLFHVVGFTDRVLEIRSLKTKNQFVLYDTNAEQILIDDRSNWILLKQTHGAPRILRGEK